ncbi:MCE family protein [Nocardioides sp. Root151]|uniref:MCE family protein n=2 Tax=Nocardioides TaxID=1839 RepID=UPI0019106B7A|nr:MCE family protein [Nocardioides sp. Root151]
MIALLCVLAMAALTSCGFSVQKLPLPGGADVGDDPIEVTVTFPDALDLVPQSTVKVADVTVGKVTDISLDDNRAVVTMLLRKDVNLPANAEAEIRQTSLLGEKFVSLAAPADPAAEELGDGDKISESSTNRNPEVEEVLGALSLVLNGGGVAQLKTISTELNKALSGREDSARSVLTSLSTFMKQLDDNKADVVKAIESLNRLSITANNQKASITTALDELPAALVSIDKQRSDLVKMLKSLARLGNVGTRVIKASKASTIDALTQLNPVLTELAKTGDDLANSFSVLLTYPFVDESVGRDPQVAKNLHMGDYVNLSLKLDIRLDGSMALPVPTLVPSEIDPTVVVNDLLSCLTSGSLSSKACVKVLRTPENLLKLQRLCKKPANQNLPVCKLLNGLPDLGLGTVGDGLGLDNLGLGRAAPGTPSLRGTANLDQLMQVYNPTLVRVLLPGVSE